MVSYNLSSEPEIFSVLLRGKLEILKHPAVASGRSNGNLSGPDASLKALKAHKLLSRGCSACGDPVPLCGGVSRSCSACGNSAQKLLLRGKLEILKHPAVASGRSNGNLSGPDASLKALKAHKLLSCGGSDVNNYHEMQPVVQFNWTQEGVTLMGPYPTYEKLLICPNHHSRGEVYKIGRLGIWSSIREKKMDIGLVLCDAKFDGQGVSEKCYPFDGIENLSAKSTVPLMFRLGQTGTTDAEEMTNRSPYRVVQSNWTQAPRKNTGPYPTLHFSFYLTSRKLRKW